MTTICAVDVEFRYAGAHLTAIHRFSASFGPGIHGIIGPNGAGKSTLLRLLAGVLRPTSGSVMVAAAATPTRVGYLGHLPGLSESLTVAENLRYWCRVIGISSDGADFEIARSLDLLTIGGLSARAVSTLSRGQRQRVALARAFLDRPTALLLDEPFANVDPATRAAIAALLRRVTACGDTTVIVSSHDLDQIEHISDNLLVLKDGGVILHRPMEHILAEFPTHGVIVQVVSVPGFAVFLEDELQLPIISQAESGARCTLRIVTRADLSAVVEKAVQQGFPIYEVHSDSILSSLSNGVNP